MKHLVKQPVTLFLLIITALGLAACGPAIAENESGSLAANYSERGNVDTAVNEAETNTATTVDASDAEPAPEPIQLPAAVTTDVATVAYDANGIEVGFTAEGRPYRGNPDAPIVIHEYSDYQCPYCAHFTKQTMPSLLENQIANGEALLVFYDYPITSIHPQALVAANAARCAGEQSATAYWEMHDALFGNSSEWANGRAETVFSKYAAGLGLDVTQFDECQASDRYHDTIMADVDYGTEQGISSTPSFFINEQPLIGAQPLDVFNQVITAVQNGEVAVAQPDETANEVIVPTPATIVTTDVAGAYGNPNAAVTIIEYTDYQCPYCARHVSQTLPQILQEMVDSGRVYYMIKDFPLESIHPQARLGAVAARCAGEQDAYWGMHDALFTSQGTWSGTGQEAATAIFAGLAADLELDSEAFDACMSSGKFDDVIESNLQEGVSLGVRGTPAFFIDGYPVSGAQPYDLFAYAVELAEAGTLAEAYTRSADPTPTPTPSGPANVPTDGAYAIGDPDAPVTIVEYTDFQCPYCARHHTQTYPQIVADYVDEGLVYYVFKEFPLTSIHPQAFVAAEAARCAGAQGAYVGMHDMLFARQEEWSGHSDAEAMFAEYAAELELDTAQFTTCMESNAEETAVYADLNEGVSLGINGTPAFFVNGYFLNGAQPYSTFQEAIEYFLTQ